MSGDMTCVGQWNNAKVGAYDGVHFADEGKIVRDVMVPDSGHRAVRTPMAGHARAAGGIARGRRARSAGHHCPGRTGMSGMTWPTAPVETQDGDGR
jgi:hypothetical protein